MGEPDWAPLENAIPYEWCGGFMFMGYVDDIRLYKHIHTRHYLNLDSKGWTYRYTGGGYVRTSFEAAIEHVFDGLAELGVTRSGDHVLIMSNGGFGGIHEKLLQRLEQP